jgi:4'-phosphopantetheinyl transferase
VHRHPGPGRPRPARREAIRAAIVDALVQLSGLPPQRIVLHAEPGEAPWALLDAPAGQRRAWLAISHDGELSVAAISLHGAVGIDVTQVMDIPDWQPVARDYLGPDVAAALAALPAPARVHAFARAWTEREARLKCLGRELSEWSADGDRDVAPAAACPVLPEGYVGALALPPDPECIPGKIADG